MGMGGKIFRSLIIIALVMYFVPVCPRRAEAKTYYVDSNQQSDSQVGGPDALVGYDNTNKILYSGEGVFSNYNVGDLVEIDSGTATGFSSYITYVHVDGNEDSVILADNYGSDFTGGGFVVVDIDDHGADSAFYFIQSALDRCDSGDVVELITEDTPYVGDITIETGITLQSQAGERPELRPWYASDTVIEIASDSCIIDGFRVKCYDDAGTILVQYTAENDTITIKDCIFDGAGQATYGIYGTAGSDTFYMDTCTFNFDSTDTGLYLPGTCYNIQLDSCAFNSDDACDSAWVFGDITTLFIDNCVDNTGIIRIGNATNVRFYNDTISGGRIQFNAAADSVAILNCSFDSTGTDTQCLSVQPGSDTWLIENTTFTFDTGDTAITFNPGVGAGICNSVTIQDDTFTSTSSNSNAMIFGAVDKDTIMNCTIEGTTRFHVVTNDSKDINIKDNTFQGVGGGLLIIEDPTNAGGATNEISDFLVLNNTFQNKEYGVALYENLDEDDVDETTIKVKFNNFTDCDSGTAPYAGAMVDMADSALSGVSTYWDGRHNWWGHISGPGSATYGGTVTDPVSGTNASGSGDTICAPFDTVRFDVYLGSSVETANASAVPASQDDYPINESATASITLLVDTNATGTVTIIVAQYSAAPAGGFSTSWPSPYKDIYVPEEDIQHLDRLEVTFDVPSGINPDADTPIWYYDETNQEWAGCDSWLAAGGDIIVYLDDATVPALTALTGLAFACKGSLAGEAAAAEDDDDDKAAAALFKCFIASACYGTPTTREVKVLCKFRDEYLLTNTLGRVLMKTYYTVSPPVAEFISHHSVLRKAVRMQLKPLVWLSERLVSDKE